MKKENTSYTEPAFLGLHLYINEFQIQTSLYDERKSCNFNVIRFSYKSSTVFFATISAEILPICRATCPAVQFIKTSMVFLNRTLRQRVDPLGVKKVLVKMCNNMCNNKMCIILTTGI